MPYIPPKQCPICREIFTPQRKHRHAYTETCGKRTCAARWGVRNVPPGERMVNAIAAKKAKAAARLAALLAEQFGVLTEREQALFLLGEKHGWQYGYNARMAHELKARRARGEAA